MDILNIDSAEHLLNARMDNVKDLIVNKCKTYGLNSDSDFQSASKLDAIREKFCTQVKEAFKEYTEGGVQNEQAKSLSLESLKAVVSKLDRQMLKKAAEVVSNFEKSVLKEKTARILFSSNTEQMLNADEQKQINKYIDRMLYSPTWRVLLRTVDKIVQVAQCITGKIKAPVWSEVVRSFDKVEKSIQEDIRSERGIDKNDLSEVALEKRKSLKAVAKPTDVVVFRKGFDIIARTAFVPTKKAAQRQLKAFLTQMSSTKELKTIKKKIVIPGPSNEQYNEKLDALKRKSITQVANTIIPGNKHFDEERELEVFESIYGDIGLSSADKAAKHAQNLRYDVLQDADAKDWLGIIRHAVIAGRKVPEEERQAHADQKAKDIITMAVANQIAPKIQKISSENITEELKKLEKEGIDITVWSMSLITPDFWRSILPEVFGAPNELNFLKQQTSALERAANNDNYTVRIHGQDIKVNVKALCFNYGVNEYAKLAGSFNQNKYNKKTLKLLGEMIGKLPLEIKADGSDPRKEIKELHADIKKLSKKPQDYIKQGKNIYELPAKLILLGDLMQKQDPKLNVSCLLNCMSGKDRTGAAAAVIKTFKVLHEELGCYPTHDDLEKNNYGVQDRFVEVYIAMMQQYGGLEVTEENTSAYGYKLQEAAAKLYPENSVWSSLPNGFTSLIGFSNAVKS